MSNSNTPNSEGGSTEENAPVTMSDLTAGEALLLIAVRTNDLLMFLGAVNEMEWLNDSRMALCRAVYTNDLRMFLTALNIDGLLAKDTETAETPDTE